MSDKTYRIMLAATAINVLWFLVGTDKISKLIYRTVLKARAYGMIPAVVWHRVSSVSSAQGVTISSIVNNLLLHGVLVIAYECGRPMINNQFQYSTFYSP